MVNKKNPAEKPMSKNRVSLSLSVLLLFAVSSNHLTLAQQIRPIPNGPRIAPPGEYTVKVFYKGEQVRETKFNIDAGDFADNGLVLQNKISTDKIFLPVTVMGTADKWNPANAKRFCGNPRLALVCRSDVRVLAG